ncbi:phosphoribosylformylglycinamidine synthase [Flavobacteriaceae bacterium Ap0902]|nr:phosphoribosylformylglycinamidine synthase [Flavobacteriaceae bacterium Ap0902]
MNRRIFIEKKPEFDYLSKDVTSELRIVDNDVDTKVYIVYDIFNLSDAEFDKVKDTVFADPVMDIIHTEAPDVSNFDYTLAIEFLPGQYDQRADSAEQAVALITGNENIKIRTATYYAFHNLNLKEVNSIKKFLINTVDAREKDMEKLSIPENPLPSEVMTVEGFIDLNADELKEFYDTWNFAFGLDDLAFIQEYFKLEKRNPTETELKLLDTYWSDHCRHTTFFTELTNIKFEGDFQETLQAIFDKYIDIRRQLGREEKPITLMDLGTIAAKYFRANGKLENLVVSDEINACTIEIEAEIDGEKEPWYLLFKNETHNHPTEIEPFGGASTCIGGAIRDPLSGRAFVYQAMRVTGSANPLEPIENTLKGKLPQRKITKEAANGYSSYGNQIGLATSHVAELYHEGYKAKRMEVGFVMGAAPVDWVVRENPIPGDKIIVLGGKTGRDGVGGATGSSKVQQLDAIETMSAEVQKGDAVQERKIQRLFRKPEVTTLIKKSNDFGAGGVSVAIGEIADGVKVNLEVLPVKYEGLNATELAISESQERMAVVVSAENADNFIELANQENVIAVVVGEVTNHNRVEFYYKGKKVVDLDRIFLDTAGVQKSNEATAVLSKPKTKEKKTFNRENFLSTLKELNVAGQKGLIEKFDSTVGQTTVLMPLGGKNQLTPALASVHTLPVTDRNSQTVSMASWGFSPDLASENTLLSASYAVVESVARIVASGGDYKEIRLSFQEYFERLGTEAQKWGKPLAALLGALDAQLAFEIAAIGGKDSMSGTYQELNVPPTLISFAAAPGHIDHIISPEFKRSGHFVQVFHHEPQANGMPNYEQLKSAYSKIYEYIKDGKVVSAQLIKDGGLAVALAQMSFGNELGAEIKTKYDLLTPMMGSLVLETTKELDEFTKIGQVSFGDQLVINDESFDIDELIHTWLSTFEELFPTQFGDEAQDAARSEISATIAHEHKHGVSILKAEKPKVVLPIFSGTNCEYESQKVFEESGAEVSSFVFNNLNPNYLEQSIDKYVAELNNSQIMMLSGGFSAGDEPDGSAKFMVSVLKNERIKEAVHQLIARGGLVLGICNGFQALIKSGLVPYGEIRDLDESSPTLAHNKIGRHISQMVDVKVTNDHSPWLKGMKNEVYRIPISHGEGRFVANKQMMKQLMDHGQIATQYVDHLGKVALDMPFNPNGAQMGIEGITDKTGRIYGRMGHPERYRAGLLTNIPDAIFMDIFSNGVKYFKD